MCSSDLVSVSEALEEVEVTTTAFEAILIVLQGDKAVAVIVEPGAMLNPDLDHTPFVTVVVAPASGVPFTIICITVPFASEEIPETVVTFPLTQ